MKVLDVQKVSKKYNQKIVIDQVSFEIHSGKIVGLVGPNGAGKSTLMKMIVDIIKSDSGKILVCGYDVQSQRQKALEKMSVIIEESSLYGNLSVKEFMKLNAYLRNVNQVSLDNAFEYLDFHDQINKKIKKLSLGMKQQVALATAFMNDSQLYILDEPTNGLDYDNVLKFRNKMKELKSQDKTVLISSHMLKELQMIVDYYLFLCNGKIVFVENDDDIERKYQEVFHGS